MADGGPPLWPGSDKPSEVEKIEAWWNDAKKEWEDLFTGTADFELWDEFDLGRNPKLLEEINNKDYNSVECDGVKGPFELRFKMSYDEKYRAPSMFDWDEKMSKKGIVADSQPKDEKKDWFLPLLYQSFYPYESEDKTSQMVAAAKKYFREKPGTVIFIKGTLGGGSGVSIKWCDAHAVGTAQPMYRLKEHDGWEADVAVCAKEIGAFTRNYKKSALEKIGWANPAGTYGYPGILLEPGFEHHVEVKTHLVWGKLISIGSGNPIGCLHISNGYNGTFEKWRGYENDPRPTKVDGKTVWDVVKETKAELTDGMLKRVKTIGEAIAKHADFARVDIFINTDNGNMVVNEIEAFYGVCGYGYDTNKEVVRRMARVWVEGWQKLEKAGRIKRVKRLAARYQDVAPEWNASFVAFIPGPEVRLTPGWVYGLIGVLWPLSLLVACFGVYHFSSKSAHTSNAPDSSGVELRNA